MPRSIKLYGAKGERFEQIKRSLTAELGYEPTNSEVLGMLMAGYGDTTRIEPSRKSD